MLPGSRRSEVSGLIGFFGDAVASLRRRGHRLKVLLPTVPHVLQAVGAATADWEVKPEITVDPEGKWEAFGQADAAMIASGTVSLELALCGVPMYSCYSIDPLGKLLVRMLTTWSALLPNIIADRPVVTEYEAKSISNEHTFDVDCSDAPALREKMIELAEHVGRRLRRSGKTARGVQIKIRYDDFRTFTRQKALKPATSRYRDLLRAMIELYEAQKLERPVRLLGFGVAGFDESSAPAEDGFLFPEMNQPPGRDKDQRLDRALDKLRDAYGDDAIRRGKWK